MMKTFEIIFAVLITLIVVGCTSQQRTTTRVAAPSVSTITNTDECATRLHDICGAMLLYYSLNHHLPDDVRELGTLPGGATEPLVFACPVSQLPYQYNSAGIARPGQAGERIVLYDATPAHAGHRWCVSIIEPSDPSGPLITKVIAMKEDAFVRAMEGRTR